jgi:hypothetical protein
VDSSVDGISWPDLDFSMMGAEDAASGGMFFLSAGDEQALSMTTVNS